jgi:hypothetical protein
MLNSQESEQMLLDPYMAHIHSEHRRHVLLEEAAHHRLITLAREAVRSGNQAPRHARPHVWRPALYRVGVWLVGAGQRLQAAAQPRVLAA